MKGLTLLAVSVWWIAAGSWAQTPVTAAPITIATNPAPTIVPSPIAASPMATAAIPVATIPFAQVLTSPSSTKAEIRGRIKEQENRIKTDSGVGKLTVLQANALLADLKSIKDKRSADYLENGKKELTSDQKAELNGMLDDNEKSIGDRNGIQDYN